MCSQTGDTGFRDTLRIIKGLAKKSYKERLRKLDMFNLEKRGYDKKGR